MINVSCKQKDFLETKLCVFAQEIKERLSGWGVTQKLFDNFLCFLCKIAENEKIVEDEDGTNEVTLDSYDPNWICNVLKKMFQKFRYDNDECLDYCYILGKDAYRYSYGKEPEILINYSPEEGGPRVFLNHKIPFKDQLNLDVDVITAYRGMSYEEYENGIFGCFWTLEENVARTRFAKNDKIVVYAHINKDDIFWYDKKTNEENQIVIRHMAIKKEDVIIMD